MTQTNAQHIQNNAIGRHGIPRLESLPPFADLSKVSFAVRTRVIQTEEQLREFIERNVGDIYRMTLAEVRNSEERAREIVQELYPRLVTMLAANPEGIREPWALVRVVTRHLAIDGYRKSERYRERIRVLRESARPPSQENDREKEEELIKLVTLMDDMVKTLEPREGHIITGVFLKGLLSKDIGHQLGLSESRVSELKRHAIERIRPTLRARIEQECRDCFWSRGIARTEERENIRS